MKWCTADPLSQNHIVVILTEGASKLQVQFFPAFGRHLVMPILHTFKRCMQDLLQEFSMVKLLD
jgi:hypothetical protein